MGLGTSKYFSLKDAPKLKEKQPGKQPNVSRKTSDIKYEVLKQLEQSSHIFEPHIRKDGVSFFSPLRADNKNDETASPSSGAFRQLWTKRIKNKDVDSLSKSYTAKEREKMAEIMMKENLKEKGRQARIAEERRLQVLKRRERKEEEIREKYLEKMKKIEEKNTALERLHTAKSKVSSLYQNKC